MENTNLTYEEFFEANQKISFFNDLLMKCIASKGSLHLSLNQQGVSISVLNTTSKKVTLEGRWRSPQISCDSEEPNALMLAPFFFIIEKITMPHCAVYSMGRPYRSIADFFMRNYFFGACRSGSFEFKSSSTEKNNVVTKKGRDLSRRYLWILKDVFREPVWGSSNVEEMLILNAHLPVFEFESPILEDSAMEYRKQAMRCNGGKDHNAQKNDLTHIRQKIMSHH